MGKRKSASIYSIRIFWEFLKRLIDLFSHHKQSILWSFQINYIRLSLVMSGFVSKFIGGFFSSLWIFLNFKSHQIKNIIYRFKNFTSSLFQRHLICIFISFYLIHCPLNIFLLNFHFHFLFLMQIYVQPFDWTHFIYLSFSFFFVFS